MFLIGEGFMSYNGEGMLTMSYRGLGMYEMVGKCSMIGGWAEMLRMMRNIEKEKGEGRGDAQDDHEDGHGQDDDVEGGEDAQTDETISTMGIKVHGLGTFTNIFTSKINNISTEWPGRRKGVRDKILDIETEEVIREDGLGGLKEKGKRRLVENKNQEMNTYQSPMKRKRFSTVKYSDIATAEGCRNLINRIQSIMATISAPCTMVALSGTRCV